MDGNIKSDLRYNVQNIGETEKRNMYTKVTKLNFVLVLWSVGWGDNLSVREWALLLGVLLVMEWACWLDEEAEIRWGILWVWGKAMVWVLVLVLEWVTLLGDAIEVVGRSLITLFVLC